MAPEAGRAFISVPAIFSGRARATISPRKSRKMCLLLPSHYLPHLLIFRKRKAETRYIYVMFIILQKNENDLSGNTVGVLRGIHGRKHNTDLDARVMHPCIAHQTGAPLQAGTSPCKYDLPSRVAGNFLYACIVLILRKFAEVRTGFPMPILSNYLLNHAGFNFAELLFSSCHTKGASGLSLGCINALLYDSWGEHH